MAGRPQDPLVRVRALAARRRAEERALWAAIRAARRGGYSLSLIADASGLSTSTLDRRLRKEVA